MTSKRIQSRTWKATTGIFIIWPPMSWEPHNLPRNWSSSDETTRPLFQSRYLMAVEDDPGSLCGACLWITGLNHLVQTRKAKHSAMLYKERIVEHQACSETNINKYEWFENNNGKKKNDKYPKLINKSHQPKAPTSPAVNHKAFIKQCVIKRIATNRPIDKKIIRCRNCHYFRKDFLVLTSSHYVSSKS